MRRRRRSPKHDATLNAYVASAGGRGRESYVAAPVVIAAPTAEASSPSRPTTTTTTTAGPTPTLVPFEKLDVGKYVLLASRYCVDLQECFRFCKDFQCNYMLRSSQSNVVYLYKVFPTQLNNGKFQDYPDHESYAIICAEQPSEYKDNDLNHNDNSQIVQKLNCERRRSTDAYFELNEFSNLTFEQFWAISGGALYPLSEQKPAGPELYGQGQQLIKKCPKWNWMDEGVVPQPRMENSKLDGVDILA
uniref:Uncharacterized protein n=1 Tax=Romanomermis culicivorax TaxID=13658 RepID=A0A915L1E0_ROMCU